MRRTKIKLKKYYILFSFFIVIFLAAILTKNQSLIAEIKNIYSDNTSNELGFNSLMTAVSVNDIEGVRFFSKAGASLINQQNLGGATAIHIAAREGNLEIVKLLIENKANLNVIDKEGWTPLMRATLAANPEIIKLMLTNGADASFINIFNEGVIILSANSNCFDCLKTISENFNFFKNVDHQELRRQINNAYISAKNKENSEMMSFLDKMLDDINKLSILTNNLDSSADFNENEINLVVKNNNQIFEKDLDQIGNNKFKIISEDNAKTYSKNDQIIVNKVLKNGRFKLTSDQKSDHQNITKNYLAKNEKIIEEKVVKDSQKIIQKTNQAKKFKIKSNDGEDFIKEKNSLNPASKKSFKLISR